MTANYSNWLQLATNVQSSLWPFLANFTTLASFPYFWPFFSFGPFYATFGHSWHFFHQLICDFTRLSRSPPTTKFWQPAPPAGLTPRPPPFVGGNRLSWRTPPGGRQTSVVVRQVGEVQTMIHVPPDSSKQKNETIPTERVELGMVDKFPQFYKDIGFRCRLMKHLCWA